MDELRRIFVNDNQLITFIARTLLRGVPEAVFAERGEACVGVQVEGAALVWDGRLGRRRVRRGLGRY